MADSVRDARVGPQACGGFSSDVSAPVGVPRGRRMRAVLRTWSSSAAAGRVGVPGLRSSSWPRATRAAVARFQIGVAGPLSEGCAPHRHRAHATGIVPSSAGATHSFTIRYADHLGLYSPLNCYPYSLPGPKPHEPVEGTSVNDLAFCYLVHGLQMGNFQ